MCLNTRRWKVVGEQRTGEQGAQRFSADAIMNLDGRGKSQFWDAVLIRGTGGERDDDDGDYDVGRGRD